MIKLNAKTTKLFLRFLIKLQGLTELKIPLKDHWPLHLEKGETVTTEHGPGFLLSIGIVRPGEPAYFEFRMKFIVIDNRQATGKRMAVLVYPVSTQDDINDVAEESAVIVNQNLIRHNVHYQRAHANLAYTWLLELSTAGYLR